MESLRFKPYDYGVRVRVDDLFYAEQANDESIDVALRYHVNKKKVGKRRARAEVIDKEKRKWIAFTEKLCNLHVST